MGKIMEAVFCVFYLIFTSVLGFKIIAKSEGKKLIKLFGVMTLVLVFGDAFHLVPRIIAAINPTGDYSFSLGIGKLVTSVTMTVFYVILYFIYEMRYEKRNILLRSIFIILSVIRIGLCFFPQNDWTGSAPVLWGVYRNIPFLIIGIITVCIYFKNARDKHFKFMWLAVLLSFVFYIPVVLWADVSPMIGMLMLPKTIMYMWIVVMGYKFAKSKA